MPTEMNIRPETRKNFRLGVILEDSFRFGSASFGVLSELLCLKVFWDIPFQITPAKVENLSGFRRFPCFGWCGLCFFLGLITFGQAQDSVKVNRFQFKIRQLNGKSEAITESISSAREYASYTKKELARWQNNGYPFALLRFDTISYPGGEATVVATIDAGPLIANGNLINRGDTTISVKFLRRALRFRADQPFSTVRFNRIPSMLNQLAFFEQTQAPRLEWFGNKAILHVALERRKLNTFSGILGILPQSEGKGKTLVTGNIDLGLVNLFNQGIGLALAWTRFAPSSQTADIKTTFPALGYNGLGLEANFSFFRQDSLLTKQRFDFQTVSSFSGNWKFKVGIVVARATTSLLSSDTTYQKLNTNALLFSLSWDLPATIGIVFRKKAFSLSLSPSIKTITLRSASRQVPQLETSLRAAYCIPTPDQRFGIQLQALGYGIWSEVVTLADQGRMGGFKTFRGFNENFFFTSQHLLLSVQPQFLVDQNLLVGLFSEAMFYNAQRNVKGISSLDLAWSLGIAMELALTQNRVQIAFGNGSASGLPFDFQSTKIHFGYVASF